MSSDRRKFLRNLAFGSGAVAVGIPSWGATDAEKDEALQ
ncbi:MAG: twin-arginine translocation signal domain-containing protein, partial [Chitinophagaceae bacterium]